MGLDVALGAIVLLGTLRGWYRGFTSQAVRLVGLVASVYLALPVREQARPYILARLPAIEPALLDRMLWWVSAVVSYIVLVGLLTLAIQLMKSPPSPEKTRRGDHFGGLLLGAAKAVVIAAFVSAGIQKYGADLTRSLPWADRQVQGSHALEWTQQYQPVPRVWASAPVRHFIQQIQRNGLKQPTEPGPEKQVAELDAADSGALGRSPRLDLPTPERPDPEAGLPVNELGDELARELDRIKQELKARELAP